MVLFFEILFCFFTAIGIVYLMRDLCVWLLFRKKTYCHTVTVNITTLTFDEIASLLRHYRHLLESPRAAALIGRILLLYDPHHENVCVSRWELESLLDYFDEPISLCTPQEYIQMNEFELYFR